MHGFKISMIEFLIVDMPKYAFAGLPHWTLSSRRALSTLVLLCLHSIQHGSIGDFSEDPFEPTSNMCVMVCAIPQPPFTRIASSLSPTYEGILRISDSVSPSRLDVLVQALIKLLTSNRHLDCVKGILHHKIHIQLIHPAYHHINIRLRWFREQ